MASATDPVCRMTVDTDRAPASEDYEGKTYYFCSVGCAERFRARPADYVGERQRV